MVVLSDDDVQEDGGIGTQPRKEKEDEKGDAETMGEPIDDGDGASASSEDCLVADLVPPS